MALLKSHNIITKQLVEIRKDAVKINFYAEYLKKATH